VAPIATGNLQTALPNHENRFTQGTYHGLVFVSFRWKLVHVFKMILNRSSYLGPS